jgi:hypothetical protein
MPRGLHAINFSSGSATTACFAFVPLLMWGVMWTPFRNDVDRQGADLAFVIADVGCYVDPSINDVERQIADLAFVIVDVECYVDPFIDDVDRQIADLAFDITDVGCYVRRGLI